MWDKLTRKVTFLYLYNILFWDSTDFNQENIVVQDKPLVSKVSKKQDKTEITPPQHFDNTSNLKLNSLTNLEKLTEIYQLDEDFKKVSQGLIIQKLDLFEKNKQEFETQLQSALSSWSQTYSIVKAILFTFLTEVKSITKKDVILEVDTNKSTELEPEVSEIENDIHTQLIGKYLRLAQDYGNSQSVSVIHAVLAKILKS